MHTVNMQCISLIALQTGELTHPIISTCWFARILFLFCIISYPCATNIRLIARGSYILAWRMIDNWRWETFYGAGPCLKCHEMSDPNRCIVRYMERCYVCIVYNLQYSLLGFHRNNSQQCETFIWKMARDLFWFIPSQHSPLSMTFKIWGTRF